MFHAKTNIQEEIDDAQIHLPPFFRFCRVKVVKQEVDATQNMITIAIEPDERYRQRCHKCQRKTKQIHSYHKRTIRDLSLFDARSFISVTYRKPRYPRCGNVVEDLSLMNPYKRVTRRLAVYILELCKYMSVISSIL